MAIPSAKNFLVVRPNKLFNREKLQIHLGDHPQIAAVARVIRNGAGQKAKQYLQVYKFNIFGNFVKSKKEWEHPYRLRLPEEGEILRSEITVLAHDPAFLHREAAETI